MGGMVGGAFESFFKDAGTTMEQWSKGRAKERAEKKEIERLEREVRKKELEEKLRKK